MERLDRKAWCSCVWRYASAKRPEMLTKRPTWPGEQQRQLEREGEGGWVLYVMANKFRLEQWLSVWCVHIFDCNVQRVAGGGGGGGVVLQMQLQLHLEPKLEPRTSSSLAFGLLLGITAHPRNVECLATWRQRRQLTQPEIGGVRQNTTWRDISSSSKCQNAATAAAAWN